MNVDLYERFWMWTSTVLLAAFVLAIVVSATVSAVHPPSHTETIDPARVRTESEFAHPGVVEDENGVTVVVLAALYQFTPQTIRVPAGRPIRFRVTSPDVLHGFQIVGTNANIVVAPGYVSEVIASFPEAGEYLIVCNEYCGLSHHLMQGKLVVEDAR
jgi:cytochrome c oxidase subunit 2